LTKRSPRLAATILLAVVLWIPLGVVLGWGGSSPSLSVSDSAKVTESVWSAAASSASVEVLVVLQEQAELPSLRSAAVTEAPGSTIYQALWTTAATSQAELRAWLDARRIPYRSFYIVNALLLEVDGELLVSLAQRPEVARIMTNPRVAMPVVPQPAEDVARQSVDGIPWGVSRIGAPQVWDLGYRGEGVVVAGQDTGYAWEHPAIKTQYRGWDGGTADHDYNWHDAIHEGSSICGVDSAVPCDDDGLGHQIGVAPAARWIGCRNMRQGVGTPATYAECFEFFLAPYPVGGDSSQGDPDQAPDVINNSWSCPLYEGCDAAHIAFLEQVVTAVREAGILVVASAGNSGPACGTISEPVGMYDAAFTVGATAGDELDTIASFSSRGTGTSLIKPDLAAPGVGVESALRDGGYGYKSGTSMAAPHVVGAAALLWSALPDLRGEVTTTEILLTSSSRARTSTQCGDAVDAVPNNVYGWGRLDALAAVQRGFAEVTVLVGAIIREIDGAALPGATVHVVLDDTYTWSGASDATGLYVIRPLSGTYTVTAFHPDYQPLVTAGLTMSAGITTTLNMTLTRTVPVTTTLYFPMIFN
jgi:serine protease AprX